MSGQAKLPLGFQVGAERLDFVPEEVPTKAHMNVTAIIMNEVRSKHHAGVASREQGTAQDLEDIWTIVVAEWLMFVIEDNS